MMMAAEVVSMNMPMMHMAMIIRSIRTLGLVEMPVSRADTCSGNFSMARQ